MVSDEIKNDIQDDYVEEQKKVVLSTIDSSNNNSPTLNYFFQGIGERASTFREYENNVNGYNSSPGASVTSQVYDSLQSSPNSDVVLVGHSYGSGTAVLDAEKLINNGVSVTSVVCLDNGDTVYKKNKQLQTMKENGTNLYLFQNSTNDNTTIAGYISKAFDTYNNDDGDGQAFIIATNEKVGHNGIITSYYDDWSDYLNGKSNLPQNLDKYTITYINDDGNKVTLSGQSLLDEFKKNPSFLKTGFVTSNDSGDVINSDNTIAIEHAKTIIAAVKSDSIVSNTITNFDFSTNTHTYAMVNEIMNKYLLATNLLLETLIRQAQNIDNVAQIFKSFDESQSSSVNEEFK